MCSCELHDKGILSTYVYNVIRDKGGFENWTMIELCNKPCENKRDAERIERQYIEDLSASLNKRIPTQTKKEYRELHKEELNEKNRQYRELYKEEINERRRLQYQQKKLKDNV